MRTGRPLEARADRDGSTAIALSASRIVFDSMLFRVVVTITALACASSCSRRSGDDSAAPADVDSSVATARLGSCDRVTSMSVCSEYAGSYLSRNEAVLASGCKKLGGAFVVAECPNTNVLGSCTLSTTEIRKYYASGGTAYDPTRARTECETSYRGAWSTFQ